MRTKPADLDEATVHDALARHWGLADAELEYLPVGFGSHHWRALDRHGTCRFVTADDLTAGFQAGDDADMAFRALERAYGTAAALREHGLEFVLSPCANEEGAVIRRLDKRYALSAAVFVDGESAGFGDYESPDERRSIAGVVGRLHAATQHVDAELPRRDDFVLPCRDGLVAALDDLDSTWDTGPFGEPTRQLLAAKADAVARRLVDYDERVAAMRARPDPCVVTHGEPHRANVIRDREGGVHLVDWDTTLLAPRERDLWMVLDEALTGWDEYRAAAGDIELDEQAIELYRRRWELADIAIFVVDFRRPHEGTDDTVTAFEGLSGYLGEL